MRTFNWFFFPLRCCKNYKWYTSTTLTKTQSSTVPSQRGRSCNKRFVEVATIHTMVSKIQIVQHQLETDFTVRTENHEFFEIPCPNIVLNWFFPFDFFLGGLVESFKTISKIGQCNKRKFAGSDYLLDFRTFRKCGTLRICELWNQSFFS